jgi:hypothetical protein
MFIVLIGNSEIKELPLSIWLKLQQTFVFGNKTKQNWSEFSQFSHFFVFLLPLEQLIRKSKSPSAEN